jgi:carboxyl-terminal processing protease
MKKVYCSLLLLVLFGCENNDKKVSGLSGLSTQVNSYLNEMLTIMQNNSINRRSINWSTLKSNVIARAGNAQTIQAAEPAILLALAGLGDNHSLITTSYQKTIYSGTLSCSGGTTSVTSTTEIGYVVVSSFSGSTTQADAFAKNIQSTIRNQDNPNIKGWIVDLRGNGGGNMWPMLAGIGPILGDGVAGHFIDIDNNAQAYGYFNGSSQLNQVAITTVPSPYIVAKSNPKVAVLIDNGTGSSGEAIVIAFIGRANTRIFGVPTCGLSTANQGFTLSDGSMLFLTVSTMADRNKNKFGGKVNPDEMQTGASAVTAAVDWITK